MEYAIYIVKGARADRNLAGKHKLEPGRVKAVLVALMLLTVSLSPLEEHQEHQEHELLFRVGRKAICKSRIKIRRWSYGFCITVFKLSNKKECELHSINSYTVFSFLGRQNNKGWINATLFWRCCDYKMLILRNIYIAN